MPLVKARCEGCGRAGPRCPDCGSDHVTPREDIHTKQPSDVIDFGLELQEPPYTVRYTHVCWDCGWTETVEVTIERR